MRTLWLILFSIFSLTACIDINTSSVGRLNRSPVKPGQSSLYYLEAIMSWKGHPIKELIAAWKEPTIIKDLPGGDKSYQWLQIEEFRDGIDKLDYDYEKHIWIEESAVRYHISCVTIMEVDSKGQIYNADTEDLANCETLAAFIPPFAPPSAP